MNVKSICTLVLAATISTGLHAQGLGFKAGLNLSNFSGNSGVDYEKRVGFHFGVFKPVALSSKLILEPGMSYSAKGAGIVERQTLEISPTTELVVSTEVSFELDYLDLPVMIRYALDNQLYLQAGPSFSFVTGKKGTILMKECIGGECTGIREELRDFEDFRGGDIAINAGVGLNLAGAIMVSATYQAGLQTVLKGPEYDKIHNQNWMISVGYSIHGKNKTSEQ